MPERDQYGPRLSPQRGEFGSVGGLLNVAPRKPPGGAAMTGSSLARAFLTRFGLCVSLIFDNFCDVLAQPKVNDRPIAARMVSAGLIFMKAPARSVRILGQLAWTVK